MAGRITYGAERIVKKQDIGNGKARQMTLKAATVTMRVSYRQGIRLYAAYQDKYSDFGSTFASEKMTEEKGIMISVGTMRNLLIEAGEWKGRMRRKEYRSRRERRARFGELVQFYGSHHKWFEGAGPSGKGTAA